MNRSVTFCIKVGITLLVLAVISNTAYADTTTENANGDPTITPNYGTISGGAYTDTVSNNGATQDLYEGKVSGKGQLDCYYNLSTAIDESRISAFEIGVNAWYSGPGSDYFTVYVWDHGTNSWDSTTINVAATADGTTYTDTSTMGIEHIRDSDGNISIRFDDFTAGAHKQNTLHIDYLYVNLTYTTITSVATDNLTYKNGETITTTWTSADCFGSGESCINVEYWDETADTRFDLKSYNTSATSSTSKTLAGSEVGHEIDVYVYTASNSTGNNSTAITQADSWPYSIPNAVYPDSWDSYNCTERTLTCQCDTFSDYATEHYVYMKGEGFLNSSSYKIAYYDANGDKTSTEQQEASTSGGVLNGTTVLEEGCAGNGNWYAVVLNTTTSAPANYTLAKEHGKYVTDDDFYVHESAIPEFPAVIAAIAVCMLCAVAYLVMRRKSIDSKQEK